MAFSRQLEKQKIQSVRRHLGQMIARFHREAVDPQETELHETFELCMIQGDAFPLGKDDSLSAIVRRTGSWQHLIKSKGKPIGIAHSAAPGTLENKWSVQNFFLTPISAKIARGVAKIDKERPDQNIEVVLVTVPAKLVDFFLLRSPGKTEVYLIVGRDKSTGLVEGRFYNEKKFTQMLSDAPNITGMSNAKSLKALPAHPQEKTPKD